MFKPVAKEVKDEILNKVKNGEKVSVLANQYGVSDKSIYTWLGKKAMGTVSLLTFRKLQNENKQLKEILGIVTYELEKSKKKRH